MRRLMLLLFVAAIAAPVPGHAQVTLDMTRITCADYLAMPASQASTFSAWMSGWFNYKFGYVSVGFDDFARNVASVRQWCSTSPGATLNDTSSTAHRSSKKRVSPEARIAIDTFPGCTLHQRSEGGHGQ